MIMSRSDDVKAEVLNALHWDLAVPRHRVKVEVENGWVTMSGMVDQPYQLACAESDARKVPGVVGVINQNSARARRRWSRVRWRLARPQSPFRSNGLPSSRFREADIVTIGGGR